MLFQVSPTTFQVSSTCFQGVFQVVHVFSINCSNKFSSCSTFSQLFPAISPCGTAIFPSPGWSRCRCRSFRSATEALDIAVLSATVAAVGLGALLAEAAVITALLVTGLTVYTFRSLGPIGRWKHWSCVYVMSRIWGELWFSCGYGIW